MADQIHTLTRKNGQLITELHTEDGYINATKMAKAAGKRLSHWLQNNDTGLFNFYGIVTCTTKTREGGSTRDLGAS